MNVVTFNDLGNVYGTTLISVALFTPANVD